MSKLTLLHFGHLMLTFAFFLSHMSLCSYGGGADFLDMLGVGSKIGLSPAIVLGVYLPRLGLERVSASLLRSFQSFSTCWLINLSCVVSASNLSSRAIQMQQ